MIGVSSLLIRYGIAKFGTNLGVSYDQPPQLFKTMEYGLAPEFPFAVNAWLDGHFGVGRALTLIGLSNRRIRLALRAAPLWGS